MTELTRRERARLEAREAELVAEIESRKTASEKAADRILNPEPRDGRGAGGWDAWKGKAV